MTKPAIGSENRVKKRMNICSLGSGVGSLSDTVTVREVGVSDSTSESRLFSAGVGSWNVIVQTFKFSESYSSLEEECRVNLFISRLQH